MTRDPDDADFDRLYETYLPLLRRIAMRKFNIPRADVDALVHDVFATYLTRADQVRELRPYLIGGICNASRQYWREADEERRMFCDADRSAQSDDAVLESLTRNGLMSAALARLGPSCRETLHRFYVDGESAISIAASRDSTQNSIHQLLSYCRGRAREAYRAMNVGRGFSPPPPDAGTAGTSHSGETPLEQSPRRRRSAVRVKRTR